MLRNVRSVLTPVYVHTCVAQCTYPPVLCSARTHPCCAVYAPVWRSVRTRVAQRAYAPVWRSVRTHPCGAVYVRTRVAQRTYAPVLIGWGLEVEVGEGQLDNLLRVADKRVEDTVETTWIPLAKVW